MRQWTMKALAVSAGVMLACTPASAQTDWSEDFEGFNVGDSVTGVNGWDHWDGDVAWESLVSDAQANGGANSIDIVGNSDTVNEFVDAGLGVWLFSAKVYIPAGYSGSSYCILLNEYVHLGPYNWSQQVHFDSATGLCVSDVNGGSIAYATDSWMTLEIVINTDQDTQSVSLDGTEFDSGSWTDGISGGGSLQIQALDLYANGASSIYYDDISLTFMGRDEGCNMTLDVPSLVAGQQATISGTGPPNATYAVAYAFASGPPAKGSQGNFCVETQLRPPGGVGFFSGTIDANGDWSFTTPIPGAAQGVTVFIQAFGSGTCPSTCNSELVQRTVF